MSTVALTISGMSCQHCVRAVREALEGVAGVEVSRVDVGSAQLSYDPAVTSAAAIEEAVRDAGYGSELRPVDA